MQIYVIVKNYTIDTVGCQILFFTVSTVTRRRFGITLNNPHDILSLLSTAIKLLFPLLR